MEKISDTLLQEIINDSNHTDLETVRTFIANGYIVLYRNAADYEKNGYPLSAAESYTLLSNGAIAHYH